MTTTLLEVANNLNPSLNPTSLTSTYTRWAPTSYKWGHNPYKYRDITPVTHLFTAIYRGGYNPIVYTSVFRPIKIRLPWFWIVPWVSRTKWRFVNLPRRLLGFLYLSGDIRRRVPWKNQANFRRAKRRRSFNFFMMINITETKKSKRFDKLSSVASVRWNQLNTEKQWMRVNRVPFLQKNRLFVHMSAAVCTWRSLEPLGDRVNRTVPGVFTHLVPRVLATPKTYTYVHFNKRSGWHLMATTGNCLGMWSNVCFANIVHIRIPFRTQHTLNH